MKPGLYSTGVTCTIIELHLDGTIDIGWEQGPASRLKSAKYLSVFSARKFLCGCVYIGEV
jgi:hypothetical protein